MSTRPSAPELAAVLREAARPPLRERRFWVVQAMVVVIAGVHLLVDLHSSAESGAFPVGIPVALLVLPVGYAAVRYGLAGSAATAVWSTLLWLPDLLLPNDRGHAGDDLIELALIDVVAFVFGQRIEAERLVHARVERATAERLAVIARYRQLFDANRAPILVLDAAGHVTDANPAAEALLGSALLGRPLLGARAGPLLGAGDEPALGLEGRVVTLADGHDYRIGVAELPTGTTAAAAQVVLEDVTSERREGQRASAYASLVVRAEEDQRRRLSRELHDEPLQLFLHLARRLDHLAGLPGVPEPVVHGLGEARRQALEAATRLRALARELRPPALDQLGLAAATTSLAADVEDHEGLRVEVEVAGDARRLEPAVELGAFRIVQEAVRNAARHAAAARVSVRLEFGAAELVLRVADDGRGLPAGSLDDLAEGHLGVLGMRERARLLGGRLEILSSPGRGTTVEAVVPLAARPSPTGPQPPARLPD